MSEVGEVGFVGLGAIGRPMAERLLGGGLPLTVFDVREDAVAPLVAAGARRARSLDDLLERCRTVIVSLPSPKVVRDVLLSVAARPGRAAATVVNNSTVGATVARDVAAHLAGLGIDFVDCPISGGPAVARAGTLSVIVSGAAEPIARLRPVLELWGHDITVVGDAPGAAQVVKLANNVLAAVSIVATSEAMAMGARAGLDPAVMIAALNAGSARNYATSSLWPRCVLPGTFDFGSPLDMLMKDVDLAVEQGEALGVPMWVCQAARLVAKQAQFAGHGGEDVSRLVEVVGAAGKS